MPHPGDIVFVNFDATNSGSHDGATRRQVRSEAAKASYKSGVRKPKSSKKRRAQEQAEAEATAGASSSAVDATRSEYSSTSEGSKLPSADTSRRTTPLSVTTGQIPLPEPPFRLANVPKEQQQGLLLPPKPLVPSNPTVSGQQLAYRPAIASATPPQPPEQRVQTPAVPVVPHGVSSGLEWPVDFQPFYPALLDYMWPFMLRGWVKLGTTEEDRSIALPWVQRLTLTEPPYFFMNMLSVSGDLTQRGQLDERIKWWLKAQTVAAINEALRDPARQLAIGTILSVGRIALHEITLGNREQGQRIHRPAQARMIRMVGGLAELGLPKLVQEHIMWAERLMTLQTGVRMIPAETMDFSTDEADVQVLNAYMPHRVRGPGRI